MGEKISKQTPTPSSNTTILAPALTSTNPTTHTADLTRRRSSLVFSSIVQNFLLVWLDENVDETNNTVIELQRIVHTIDKFHNVEECINFLNQIKDEKIFLIVSESLSQQIIPRIHHLTQLDCIYVLCRNKSQHKQWSKGWLKVKGIYTHITPICESLKQATQQCDRNSIPISFVSVGNDTETQDSDQLDQTFMYTQLLKEILLDIEYNEDSVKDFTNYCHDSNYGNLNIIDKFRQEYYCQTPIYWYTYPSFLCSMLNRALRTLEVDTIINLGFFIRDLNWHIRQLYTQQFAGQYLPLFTVYRGQGLSKIDFEKLIKTKDGLIAFNNFLSTSTDRNVSLTFADSNRHNPELIGVLFQMTIDPSILSTSFAWTGDVSFFKQQEQEILFSMHTLFRIGEIKPIDSNNRLWEVELKLTNDTDKELRILTNKIRMETRGSTGQDRLGRLLFKLGHFSKAEQIYRLLLNQTSNEIKKAHLYNQIGNTKNHQGNYMDAIIFYRKAIKICQNILPSDHIFLACCYNNIGQMYQRMGEYSIALAYHQKALNIKEDILPSDHLDLAKSFGHIGLLCDKLGEYSEALSSHTKALQIRQKKLPTNHSTLAHSYINIGSVYNNMGEYSRALSFYKKAHIIMEKTLPQNHPDLARSYGHIGLLYDKMGSYSQALVSHEKALEIRQNSLPSNHSFLANSYNNIGLVYNNMGEYSKALLEYKKGLKIDKATFQLDHPHLATSYNNMAVVYMNMKEYPKARSLYKKALRIYKKTLPSNHPCLAITRNEIGLIYYKMGNSSKALSYYKRALRTYRNPLLLNHPHLAVLYCNIGTVYTTMGQYSKALLSHQNALEIKQKTFPSNHSTIAISYSSLGMVYLKMGEYSKALSSYEKALESREQHIPLNHNILVVNYNNIGLTYLKMGEYKKALLSHEKAVSISHDTPSPNYSEMANAYYNIGFVYFKMGQYSNARPFYERALHIVQSSFPSHHFLLRHYHEKLNSLKEQL
jgi:tetratricopeptide (TPR) repeat protein